MAETTLTLAYEDFLKRIQHYRGEGYTVPTDSELDYVRETIMDEGLRRFYSAHEWNFLYPVRELEAWMTASGTTDGSPVESGGSTTVTATEDVFYPSMVGKSIDFTTSENSYTITAYTSSTVVVVSGDASGETDAAFTITADGYYRLPDNFAGLRDGFTFDPSSTECYYDIKMASEHKVRSELMREETGRPYICAVRPVEFDPTLGQRFDVMLHPIPDADYTLNYRAIVVPERLDSVNKYPLGGPVHSSTVLESMLAVAEELEEEDSSAAHRNRYMQMLADSIRRDAEMYAPESLGRNTDRGRIRGRALPKDFLVRGGYVTYDSTLY